MKDTFEPKPTKEEAKNSPQSVESKKNTLLDWLSDEMGGLEPPFPIDDNKLLDFLLDELEKALNEDRKGENEK